MKKSILVLSFLILSQLSLLVSASYAQNWAWAESAGGPQKVESYAITVDNAGNSYITGWFEDTLKFGSTTLVASITNNSFASDIFIAKYDNNGVFVWARKAGGNNYDYGNGITTDAAGNVYIIGLFSLTASFGSLTVTSSGDYDVFVAKYSPSGNPIWVRKGGGTGWDVGSGISIDNTGSCYVTGAYRNTATFGGTTLTSAGNYDAFVAKYDTAGTLQWAKSAGGTLDDRGLAITNDAANNCYITGFFNGSATVGTTTLTSSGASDILLAKFDAAGNSIWAKKAGGAAIDQGNAIKSDGLGNCYVTGYFNNSAFFGSALDTATIFSAGDNDIFAGKFDYKGDIQWIKHLGGVHSDIGYGIGIDTAGNSFVSGSFFGSTQFDTIALTAVNQDDAFVIGLNHAGKVVWAAQGGGLNPDVAASIAVGKTGSCYTTGYFNGAAAFGTFNINGFSFTDNSLFIAKVDSSTIINPIPTTISKIAQVNDLAIYPNPFSTGVNIQFESDVANSQINIQLYDIVGKVVTYKAVVSDIKDVNNKKQITINRGELPDGLYFGKIIVGDKTYTTRLVLIK
jgi:hypothetical protein